MNQVIRFKLRDHQRKIHKAGDRWKCVVMHRRAGKSVYCVAKLIEAASKHKGGAGQYHYIGPSIKQTKSIAWRYAQRIAGAIPGVVFNQAELRVTFPSGTTLQLLGVENIDSLRGLYSHGVVLDEAQLMPQSHWAYVLRPLLADKRGWALVSGTPAGRYNLLGWAAEQEDWHVTILPYDQTNALDPAEIQDMQKSMSKEAWEQEMECSFTAALQGAYYARECAQLVADGRLTTVKYEDTVPVVCALDLGHRDLMPVIWHQLVGTESRIIACRTYQFTSIPDMVSDWRELPWPTDKAILPHDARVRELGHGKTREEVFQSLGVETTIAPSLGLDEGIEQTRRFLKHTWIDRENALTLYEALCGYRSEKDEERQVFKVTPLHSWEAHYADAMRYLAIGDHKTTGFGPRPTYRGAVYA